MNKKHILYITYDGLTDFLGQSQVLPYILGLEKKGYRYSILSYEKEQKFPSERKIVDDLIKDLNIIWYPKKYHKRFSILATVWDIIIGILFLHKLQSKDPFEVVHCRSYISSVLGLYSKRIFKTKFIFDMRGFWADEKVDGRMWNLKNPVFKVVYFIFKWLEKRYIIYSDAVVSLTFNGLVEMKQWPYVTDKINFHVIPCCADLDLFNESHIDQAIAENVSYKGKNILTYLGSIGSLYLTKEMIDFYKLYRLKMENPLFLFVTADLIDTILKYSRQIGIPDEEIICVKAKRTEVPSYLSISTYSIFFIEPTYSKKSSSPTKLAEILAMGIPVITNKGIGDVDSYIESNKVGVVLNDFNETAYTNVLAKLSNGISSNACVGLAQKEFSLNSGVEKYLDLYRSIGL